MVLVKRTFIAEQLRCYVDERAVLATVKKEMEECVAAANQAFEEQLALQNRWKDLTAKSQRLSQKKAESQSQTANLRNHLPPPQYQLRLPA